jgi:hypothetical protein
MSRETREPALPRALGERICARLDRECYHTLKLYANQRDYAGTDYRAITLNKAQEIVRDELDAALSASAVSAPTPQEHKYWCAARPLTRLPAGPCNCGAVSAPGPRQEEP